MSNELNIRIDESRLADDPKIGNLGGDATGPPGFFAPGWPRRVTMNLAKSWLFRFLGSMLFACLVNPSAIWKGVVYVSTFISSYGGEEAKVLKDRLDGAIHGDKKQDDVLGKKLRDIVDDEHPRNVSPLDRDESAGSHPSLREKAVEKAKSTAANVVVEQAKTKVEDAKEAVVEKTQEAKQTVVDAKEKVEKKADDVVGALKQKVQERREAEHRPQDPVAIPRQPAPFRGFMPNVQVVKARCPRCGIAIDLPESARKPRGCTNCLSTYYPADARAAAKQRRGY